MLARAKELTSKRA